MGVIDFMAPQQVNFARAKCVLMFIGVLKLFFSILILKFFTRSTVRHVPWVNIIWKQESSLFLPKHFDWFKYKLRFLIGYFFLQSRYKCLSKWKLYFKTLNYSWTCHRRKSSINHQRMSLKTKEPVKMTRKKKIRITKVWIMYWLIILKIMTLNSFTFFGVFFFRYRYIIFEVLHCLHLIIIFIVKSGKPSSNSFLFSCGAKNYYLLMFAKLPFEKL